MSKIEQNKFDSLNHNLNLNRISDVLHKFKDNSHSNNLDFLNINEKDLENRLLKLLSDLGIDISDLTSNQLESLLQLLNCNVGDIKSKIDSKIVDLKFDLNQIINNNLYLNLCHNASYITSNLKNDELKDKLDQINNMFKNDPNQLTDLINRNFNLKENNLTDALTNAILSTDNKNFEQTEFLLLVSVVAATKNATAINSMVVNNPELNLQFKDILNKRKIEEKNKIDNLNKIVKDLKD